METKCNQIDGDDEQLNYSKGLIVTSAAVLLKMMVTLLIKYEKQEHE